jgi:hypothetical protein
MMPVMEAVSSNHISLAGRAADATSEGPKTPSWTWGAGRIHPNAPAGGGGPGFFRYSALIDKDTPASSSALHPHPSAPVSRFLIAAATPLKAPAPKPKAPPATVPGDINIPDTSDAATDIKITARILADGKDDSLGDRAETRTNVTWNAGTPGYTTSGNVVKSLDAKATLTITIEIQTFYGKDVRPTSPSGYGRGTTDKDKASGNVTVGFHEAKHREDYVNFIKNFKPPRFHGKARMKVKDVEKAIQEFDNQCERAVGGLNKAARKQSETNTDEVGYTKSQYLKDHAG